MLGKAFFLEVLKIILSLK